MARQGHGGRGHLIGADPSGLGRAAGAPAAAARVDGPRAPARAGPHRQQPEPGRALGEPQQGGHGGPWGRGSADRDRPRAERPAALVAGREGGAPGLRPGDGGGFPRPLDRGMGASVGAAVLIKFFPQGRGSGSGPVDYLLRGEDREHSPPEILSGDPDVTRDLIDAIDREWRYTSGVVSFAPSDAPTPDQQREVMDEFERTAFAGLDPEQYDVLWVRHSHTEGGRVELHFVTPRMELTSGRALNIAPPGWEGLYGTLRDTLNGENHWADPNDPARARDREIVREAEPRAHDRATLHELVESWVVDGRVENRPDIVRGLQDLGLQVPREAANFITVLDPATDQRFRLKGPVYAEGWTRDAQLERALGLEAREREAFDLGAPRGGGGDASELAHAARAELERRIEGRAERHAEFYPRVPGHDRELQRVLEGGIQHVQALDRDDGARDLDLVRQLAASAGGELDRAHAGPPEGHAAHDDRGRGDPVERGGGSGGHELVDAGGPGLGSEEAARGRGDAEPDRGADGRDHPSERSERAVRGPAGGDGPSDDVSLRGGPPVPSASGDLSHEPNDGVGARTPGFGERLAELARAANERVAGWVRDTARFVDGWLRERHEHHLGEAGRTGAVAAELGRDLAELERAAGRVGGGAEPDVARFERNAREFERDVGRLERAVEGAEREAAQEIERQRELERERSRNQGYDR